MADQTITPIGISVDTFKESAANTWADLTAANAGVLTPPRDGKYLLQFVDAAGGAIITIKKGDGYKASQGDLVSSAMTIVGTYVLTEVVLSSARFKAISGTDKGKIRITVSAAVKCRCVYIP